MIGAGLVDTEGCVSSAHAIAGDDPKPRAITAAMKGRCCRFVISRDCQVKVPLIIEAIQSFAPEARAYAEQLRGFIEQPQKEQIFRFVCLALRANAIRSHKIP